MDTSRFIASHVVNLPKSGIRDFFDIVAKMKDAISLGVGEPDFDTPWHIREAGIYALEKGKTHYTSNLGLIELRRAINKYVEQNFNVSYAPENEVIITVGVSEGLDLACRALINPGDKVMYHQPCYVSYSPSITLAHGIPVPVPTFAKDGFALTVDALRAAWQPGCKILMLNLPCNPTGGTCDPVSSVPARRWSYSSRSPPLPPSRTSSSTMISVLYFFWPVSLSSHDW